MFVSFAHFYNGHLPFLTCLQEYFMFQESILCQLYVLHSPHFSFSSAYSPPFSFQFICLSPFFLSLLPFCSVTKCDNNCTCSRGKCYHLSSLYTLGTCQNQVKPENCLEMLQSSLWSSMANPESLNIGCSSEIVLDVIPY